VLETFLVLGGNEVVNAARSYGYAQTVDCRVNWLKDPECDTLAGAQTDPEYHYANIADAPWYDPDVPEAARFLGVYGLTMSNLSDSTREAQVSQKTGDGAKTTGYRHGSREVRVRVWLTALGGDAMEHGMTWLRNVLEPDACGLHGGTCGEAEMAFFVDCPPPRRLVETAALSPAEDLYPATDLFPAATTFGPEGDSTYLPYIDSYRRFLHSVRCVSGPFTVEERESSDGRYQGRLVEFTLLAEVPFVFGVPKELDIPPIIPTVVQDVAYNLAPYPSAEVSSGPVVVATNYATNPSLETNTTAWSSSQSTNVGAAGAIALIRSSDIAAVGTYSARVTFTASASGTNGQLRVQHLVPLAGPAGARYSFNMWATALVFSGTAVLDDIEYVVVFRDSGGTEIGTAPMGSLPIAGGSLSLASVVPPVGAVEAYVRAQVVITSWGSTAVIRIYGDAVAVTVP
jgi:hypothetical protein